MEMLLLFFFVSLDAKDDISIGLVISFNCVITLTGANFTWCPALYMVRKVLNPRGLLRLLHSLGSIQAGLIPVSQSGASSVIVDHH